MNSVLSTKTHLADSFRVNANKKLFIFQNHKISYFEYLCHAISLADNLKKKDVNVNDKIIIKFDNCYEYFLLFLAGAIGGFVVCPVNPNLKEEAFDNYKKIISPNLILTNKNELNYDKNFRIKTDDIKNYFSDANIKKDFLIIPTSGTTGDPKGILFTLNNYLLSSISFSKLVGYNKETTLYHALPLYYNAGILNTFFSPLLSGSSIIVGNQLSGLELLNFWELPMKFDANNIHITPSIALALTKINQNDEKILKHLQKYQNVFSTGSRLYETIKKKFHTRFKKNIYSIYGLTEVGGPITSQNENSLNYKDSVGSHMPEVKIKIKSIENKNVILIKTPFMMKGYVSLEGLDPSIDKDGYFQSDDVGEYINNNLIIKGRNKEIIKKKGELVSLSLIENTVLELDYILNVAAIGLEDEELGEKIVLFVELMDKKNTNLNDLKTYLKNKLKIVEFPDKIIIVPKIPKTKAGKILKSELIKMLK